GAHRERATLGGLNEVTCVAFSPDGQAVAAADGTQIKLWETATGREQAATPTHVVSFAFTPDGNSLVGTDGRAVYQSDPAAGKRAPPLKILYPGSSGGSRSPGQGHGTLAYSPDGKLLAVACLTGPVLVPGAVQVLDVATGEVRATLKGHKA